MKKDRLIQISVLFLCAFMLASCSTGGNNNNSSSNIILGTDLVKYNMEGTNEFGFNVNLISTTNNTNVEFVRFSGENTQDLFVSMKDDSFDSLKGLKHNSYYITLLGFICSTGDDKVIIDGITLKIDGKESSFDFSTPIEHYVNNVYENVDKVQSRSYPSFISTNSYSTTEYAFGYYTENDITVEDFSFNSFLQLENGIISVNGEEKGKLNELLPLSISGGSAFEIKGNLAFKDKNSSSDYDSIYCNSQLTFTYNGESVPHIIASKLVSQSVSNENDAFKAIDLMLE